MLLIVSENARSSRALTDVVREMSLSMSAYSNPNRLRDLMTGEARRIVLLSEKDLTDEVVTVLTDSVENVQFAVIVASDRDDLRSAAGAELVDRLVELPTVEWAGKEYDFDALATGRGELCGLEKLEFVGQGIGTGIDYLEAKLHYRIGINNVPVFVVQQILRRIEQTVSNQLAMYVEQADQHLGQLLLEWRLVGERPGHHQSIICNRMSKHITLEQPELFRAGKRGLGTG